MKLTLNKSTLLQVLAWAIVAGTFFVNNDVIPARYKAAVTAAVAFLSVILHQAAGNRNPDGSPAALPYAPDSPALLNATIAAYEAYKAKVDIPMAPFTDLPEHLVAAFTAAAAAAQAHKADTPVAR